MELGRPLTEAEANALRYMYEGEEPQRPLHPSFLQVMRPKPVTLELHAGMLHGFNPLLDEVAGMPRYDRVKPMHFLNAAEAVAKQLGLDVKKFQKSLRVAVSKPWRLTWEVFAKPMEQIVDRVDRVWGAIGLLREVKGTAMETQQVYRELTATFMRAASTVAASEDIYEVMELFTHDPTLNEAQRRVVEQHILHAWHGGIGMEDTETAKRISRGQHELALLASVYMGNLAAHEAQRLRFATDPVDIEGLSDPLRSRCAEAASRSGHEANAESGPWLLSVGSAGEILETAQNRELRKEAWEALRGPSSNAEVVKHMLELRHAWATDVDYSNFADMVFSQRMASRKQVRVLLAALQNASLPAAKSEVAELQSLAGGDELRPWDVAFWRRKLRLERGLDEAEWQPYLGLPSVLRGLFGLVERIFGVRVVRADGEVAVWNKAVHFYKVLETDATFPLGGFTLDPLAAPCKRRSGIWADRGVGYSRLLGQYGSSRRPVVHIVGDIAAPEDDDEGQTPLLTFAQVRGLFRAMGHALQELLTDQEEGLVAGTKGVELDAVGVPQHFLELWAYDPATLRSLGRHHLTGEAMPESMVDAIISSQAFHSGSQLLEDVRMARLDLEVHSNASGHEMPSEIASWIDREFAVLEGEEEQQTGTLLNFPEVFSTGHATGQYAGLWARALAADAFEAFQDVGIENVSEVRSLGDHFRNCILAPGGGRNPLEAFRDFRGRVPRVAPLLRRLGLLRPDEAG